MATRLNASETAVIAVTILRIRPILFLRFGFAMNKSVALVSDSRFLCPGFLSPPLQSLFRLSPFRPRGATARRPNPDRTRGNAMAGGDGLAGTAWTVLYHAQFSAANQPAAIPAPRLPIRRTFVLICRISAAPPHPRRTRLPGPPARRARRG